MNILTSELTVGKLLPLFSIKDNTPAINIELLQFKENGFEVVVQKNLYKIDQKVFYVFPDSNLKEGNTYTDSYINPVNAEGISIPCKLGSKNRVRAIKFNFHIGNKVKLFSNGIIVPINIDEFVYKAEEESLKKHKTNDSFSKEFPSFLTKTDETNYKFIQNSINYPTQLVGTLKADGSSLTVYYNELLNKDGVCSRTLERSLLIKKPNYKNYITSKKDNSDLFLSFPLWFKNKEKELIENDFVVHGKKYIDICKNIYNEYKNIYNEYKNAILNLNGIALRFELIGSASKGSGNKYNPHANKKAGVECFSVDAIIGYTTEHLPFSDYQYICEKYNIPKVELLIPPTVFNSKEKLENTCNAIFDKRLIEGIVLRNMNGSLSCKFMNNEYDSKK